MTPTRIDISDSSGNRVMTPEDALEHVQQQLDAPGQWFAEISRDPNSYLSIVKYSRRSVIVIFIERQPYRALDASVSATFDSRKRALMFEGSETVVPANIVIGKDAAIRAVSRYVVDGELDETLYWLREGQS